MTKPYQSICWSYTATSQAGRPPLRPLFQLRLSPQANQELQMLQSMLHNVALNEEEDDRICFFADSNRRVITGLIYRTSVRGDTTCPSYQIVWENFAPPRVKFVGWLITKDRINCKAALKQTKILPDDLCDICFLGSETAAHIISGCPFAQEFWRKIGWTAESIAEVQVLYGKRLRQWSCRNVYSPPCCFSYAGNFGNIDMMQSSKQCRLTMDPSSPPVESQQSYGDAGFLGTMRPCLPSGVTTYLCNFPPLVPSVSV